MSAAVLERPAAVSLGPDDVDHYACCDPDTAICGYDVSGWDDVGDESRPPLCQLCADADEQGTPCTVPGCPNGAGLIARVRRWWRSR